MFRNIYAGQQLQTKVLAESFSKNKTSKKRYAASITLYLLPFEFAISQFIKLYVSQFCRQADPMHLQTRIAPRKRNQRTRNPQQNGINYCSDILQVS